MAKGMSDTVREALSAGLREALEDAPANPGKRRGRGAVGGATKLAAGAALAAASAPLARRGASALRTRPSSLSESAARGLTDLNRAVLDWTQRQQQKRGALAVAEPAEERTVGEVRNGRPRTKRFERQAKASGGRAASASSRSRTAGSSPRSRASSRSSSARRAKSPSRVE